jgi:pyruvate formate lyase activating enzyme
MESGNLYQIDDIISKIKKYKIYMDMSKGGVTISGGEPLVQTDFVLELVKRLKEENIHVVIDTSGAIFNDKVKEIFNYADLILLDIKSMNSEKFKMLTSCTIDNTIKMAEVLNEINKPIWIRQVIVPGITDDEEDIKELKRFLDNFNNIEKVEFLPYHSMGKFKWEKLNCTYPLEGIRDGNREDIEKVEKWFYSES